MIIAFNNGNNHARLNGAEALDKLEDKRAVPDLVEFIEDDYWGITIKLKTVEILVKL